MLSLWANIVFFSLKLIFFDTLTLNDHDWHFNHDVKIIDIKSLILISNMNTFHSDWNLRFFDLFSDIFDLWLLFLWPREAFSWKPKVKNIIFYMTHISSIKSKFDLHWNIWPLVTSGSSSWKRKGKNVILTFFSVLLSIRMKIWPFYNSQEYLTLSDLLWPSKVIFW